MSDSESDSGSGGEEKGGREEEDIFAVCCEEDVWAGGLKNTLHDENYINFSHMRGYMKKLKKFI